MTRETERKAMRRSYHKPQLQRVRLKPEEAVLGSCKVSGMSGPAGAGNCAPLIACVNQGS
jgi:hypothetical protein